MSPWHVDINEDPGSNLSTFTTELRNYLNILHKQVLLSNTTLADGSLFQALSPTVEMQIMAGFCANSNEWQLPITWFPDPCAVRDNCSLLSGQVMRTGVFIGYVPFSSMFFVTKTKNALSNMMHGT